MLKGKFALHLFFVWIICYPIAFLLFVFIGFIFDKIYQEYDSFFDAIPNFNPRYDFHSITTILIFFSLLIFLFTKYISKKKASKFFITVVTMLTIFFMPTIKNKMIPDCFVEDGTSYHFQLIPFGIGIFDLFLGTECQIAKNRNEDSVHAYRLTLTEIINNHQPQLICVLLELLVSIFIIRKVYFVVKD